ncbi:MAG: HNH endonuclease, partial [Acidobacteria bacterium]|nr:HNH endonuclease [Acidobacteriota bacterium]
RTRLFKGGLRRAVQVRDRECFEEICDEPADRCQVDHIQPYEHGGETIQDNGRLACGFHNRLRNRQSRTSNNEDGDPDP